MSTETVDTQPVLIHRRCGGWLAVAPPEFPLRFGVTADTESEARSAFTVSLGRWLAANARAKSRAA